MWVVGCGFGEGACAAATAALREETLRPWNIGEKIASTLGAPTEAPNGVRRPGDGCKYRPGRKRRGLMATIGRPWLTATAFPGLTERAGSARERLSLLGEPRFPLVPRISVKFGRGKPLFARQRAPRGADCTDG